MATLRLATGIANRHPVALAVCIRWIAVWLSNAAMRRLNVIAGYSYTIPFRGMLGKKRVAGRNEMGMVNVKGDFKQGVFRKAESLAMRWPGWKWRHLCWRKVGFGAAGMSPFRIILGDACQGAFSSRSVTSKLAGVVFSDMQQFQQICPRGCINRA